MTDRTSEAVSAREITVTRVLDAPRELVWRAWAEPERLARWWGKRGWNAVPSSITMDVRPGGAFRVTTVREQDGTEMPPRVCSAKCSGRSGWCSPSRRARTATGGGEHGDPDGARRHAGGIASSFDRLAQTLT
jgi:hypothetical protein